MATTTYEIARYQAEDNEITKCPINVASAKRDVFSRFNLFSSKHRRLIGEVAAIIGQEEAFIEAERQRSLASMSTEDQEVFSLMGEIGYGAESKSTAARRRAFWYQDSTLQLIVDQFGAGRFHGVAEWLDRGHGHAATYLRESIGFYDVLKDLEPVIMLNVVTDAREYAYRVEDMTELSTDDQLGAAAVMTVSRELFHASGDTKLKSSMTSRMSSVLARVVMERPDRALDIVDYMTVRKLKAEDIEASSLIEYLDAPAQSLNNGYL